MNGFLNYAARNIRTQRGAAYGMASSGVALLVLLLPAILLLAAHLGEIIIGKPGPGSSFPLSTTVLLIIIPTLAMLALPTMGIILATAGIALSKRECQFAFAGFVINIAALAAALWSMLIQ